MSFAFRDSCPFCGTKNDENTKTIDGGLSSTESEDCIRENWIGLKSKKFFAYTVCSNCGGLYCKEYPEQNIINKLYSNMPANMSNTESNHNLQKTQLGYAKKINNYFKNKKQTAKTVLEIGADDGKLGNCLSKMEDVKLSTYDVMEPNLQVHKELNSIISTYAERGKIYSDFESINENKYDLIVAIHVLDHFFEIDDLFNKVKRLLADGGVLFFVVHDPETILSGLMGKKWPPLCPQHPHLFCRKSVELISKRNNCRLIESGKTSNYFSLGIIQSFLGTNVPLINKISLKARFGNSYYVIGAN